MATERSAAEAFGLLSDETRLDVLRTVAIAQNEERREAGAALSFSEIYERVDVDNTSKLSYHLGELTGTFLRKHEDGYAFTHAGEQLVRFVLAENYRAPSPFDPVEVDGACLFCGESTLEAAFEEQFFAIRCTDCDRPAYFYRVRPAQVRARSGDDLIDAVVWEQAGDFLKMRQGVCPDCGGRIHTDVLDPEGVPVADQVPASFATYSECEQCRRCLSIPLPYAAAFHPESVAFHWQRGVDIMGTGVWEFHQYLHDGRWSADRVASDPAEYRVELRRGTGSLRLYLDDSAVVSRTERVQERTQDGRGR